MGGGSPAVTGSSAAFAGLASGVVASAKPTPSVSSGAKADASEAVDLTIIDLSRPMAVRPKARAAAAHQSATTAAPPSHEPSNLDLRERELRSVSPISEPGFNMGESTKKKRRRPRQDGAFEEDFASNQRKRKDLRIPNP